MNSKLIAILLLIITITTIGVFPGLRQANAITPGNIPVVQNQKHRIEVVFILDTTSSMSGLIQAAKEKIWSIASSMASAQQNPDIKMGLVAFRDRGDNYVTKVLDLSSDLDSMYASLMDLQAQGGGDGPESVNQALDDAINRITWSEDPGVYRVAFLIGDAPPHMDYTDDVKFPATLQKAKTKGILVNTIQSGQQPDTQPVWKHIASLGNGDYFQVEQSGNAVAVTTPYDRKLASLAAKLEATRIFYGNEKQRRKQESKAAAAKKLKEDLSEAALARRSVFNATGSGKANLLGKNELVEAVSSGQLALEDIVLEEMPASMQAMAPQQQKAHIAEKAKRRDEIRQQIKSLSKSRQQFIKQQISKEASVDSLDEKIYRTIKHQAKDKGLIYDSETAEY